MENQAFSRLIWLPTGGHIGDMIFIVSVMREALEYDPSLKVDYVLRRNAKAGRELSAAYERISIIDLPYRFWGAAKTVLTLLSKRAVVLVPPPRKTHPLIVKVLAFIFKLRGHLVIGFADGPLKERDAVNTTPQKPWPIFSKTIFYDAKKRYIDNLRSALNVASIKTQPIASPPKIDIIPSQETNFLPKKPYSVIHPFGNMSTLKTLPWQRWQGLIKKLHEVYPDHEIVITGAKIDEPDAQKIISSTKNTRLTIDLTMNELATLLKNTALYIGIDTGPSHLAGVLETPSIILAQRNDPIWLPDYNPKATMISALSHCVCDKPGENCVIWEDGKPYRKCVYYLKDEEILNAIKERVVL